MKNTFLLLLFISVFTSQLRGQADESICDTEVCRLIMRNIKKIKALEEDKKDLISKLDQQRAENLQFKKDIEKNTSSRLGLSALRSERYFLDQKINNLERDYAIVVNRQNSLLKEIKQLEEDNQEIVRRNTRLSQEIKDLYISLNLLSKELDFTNENINRILYLDSYINDFTFGYTKNKEVVYSETRTTNGDRSLIVPGSRKQMDYIALKGVLTELNGDSALDPNIINGYILIYVDGRLQDSVRAALNRVHEDFIPGFRRYTINLNNIKLNNPIKEGDDVILGFVETEVFETTKAAIVRDLVEAKENNIFMITSEEPTPFEYYSEEYKITISNRDIHILDDAQFSFKFYDQNQVDGDIVNVFFNKELMIADLKLPEKGKAVIIDNQFLLNGDNILTFEVVSEGSSSPCTIEYQIISNDGILVYKGPIFGKKNKRNPSILIRYIEEK